MTSGQDASTTRHGYRNILRTSSLVGGASVVNVLIGTIRTKLIAILLGPAGVGLFGLYSQVAALASTVAGLGLPTSGVRQVAEAAAANDSVRVARTVLTLRRTAWVTGLGGSVLLAGLAYPVSSVTFGDSSRAADLVILSVTVLLSSISGGQTCLLRGTRRISDVARASVLGALGSTAVAIPCVYAWGIAGVVPALVLGSAAMLVASWSAARRVMLPAVDVAWRASWREARSLLTLGFSFMASGLVTTAATYLIQVLLVRRFGINDAGLYQAAFSLSGVLIGFVLGAMGADYFPRLTGLAEDERGVLRLLNEQSQVSILLALPGLVAMMVFSPLVIRVFFDARFGAAIPILRWCVLGMMGRVLSWPLGFVLLARGKGRLFFMTEVAASSFHVLLVAGLSSVWGVEGAGVAFMLLYAGYLALMLGVVRSHLGGHWDGHTTSLALTSTGALCALQAVRLAGLPPGAVTALDAIVLIGACAWSSWRLYRSYRHG